MTEILGDVVAPSEFILPILDGAASPEISGAMWLSGGQVYFYNGISGGHLVSNT